MTRRYTTLQKRSIRKRYTTHQKRSIRKRVTTEPHKPPKLARKSRRFYSRRK